MNIQLKYPLKELLRSAMTGDCTELQLRELYRLIYSIAHRLVCRKVASGKARPDLIGLNPDDLTHDCIADLFQRDDAGTLIQIKAYAEGLPLEDADEEELLAYLRRLVFAKVNNNLFRIYNEADPSLGKILRNIKLALDALQNFQVIENFDELCLAPIMCDTLEEHPQLDRDELERLLRDHGSANDMIPTLMAKLSRCLLEQTERSRVVPLMTIAFVFRSLYAGELPASIVYPDADKQLLVNDTMAIIKDACKCMKQRMSEKYVGKEKIARDIFDNYFEVIEQSLIERIISQDGEEFSYYERLKKFLPELTKEEYHGKYKSHVEYLGRLTYDHAVEMLRKNL